MSLLSRERKLFVQDLFYIAGLSAFFLIFNLDKGSLASWDEAIYASVAKDAYELGHWLNLTWGGGQPWFDKPPLCIWATAFFYSLFGVNEFSARLFSALCGMGVVTVTYLLGARLFNRWTGFLGAMVLLSSSHFIRFTRFGMMDAPLTFFLTLALYFFWLGRQRNRYLIFSGIAIGLALMTKGFAAFLIMPVVWVYCWWADELEILTRSSYWIGVMIAVLIALPWNLYELVMHREAFMGDVVVKHLIHRTTKPLEGHLGNYYFYIRTLVNKYHPWILVGIVSAPFFLFKTIRERKSEVVFLSSWMFVIFFILTLIQTKLPWYILPVYPALSLSIGYYLAKVFGEEQRSFIRIAFLAGMILHIFYSHIFDHDYSRSVKGLAPLVQREMSQKSTLYLYNYHEAPAVFFYMNRRNGYLDDRNAFLFKAREEGEFFCMIQEKNLKDVQGLLPSLKVAAIGSFEDFSLLARKK